MISILLIGSLRSPPKGETAEWYMKYMTLCFSSPYFSFPLEGNAIKLRISQIFSDRKLLRVCGFIMQQNHNNSSYIFNKFQ